MYKRQEYDVAMYTHKKMKTDPQKALEVLKELLPILENQGDFSNDALFETLKAFAGEKGCLLYTSSKREESFWLRLWNSATKTTISEIR